MGTGSSVRFEAGNTICLEPGFTVQIISEFMASIANCGESNCVYSVDVQSSADQFSYNDTSFEIDYRVIETIAQI